MGNTTGHGSNGVEHAMGVAELIQDIATETVELAHVAPTADAVRRLGSIQRGLGRLRDHVIVQTWSAAKLRGERDTLSTVAASLEADALAAASKLAIVLLGYEPGDVTVTDPQRVKRGLFVRVLTRDGVTHGVRFDSSWTHTFVDAPTCLLCEGEGHTDCSACGGTGGDEDAQRCAPCRGRGVVGCSCAKSAKAVA